MQNSKLKDDPEGLVAAAGMAFSDVSHGIIKQSNQKLKAQVKTLQKKTMVEGSGKPSVVVSQSPTSSSVQRAKQSGTVQDAAKAMKDIFKSSGMLSDE